jgi:tetratricopeptide (TPR) repeat protein
MMQSNMFKWCVSLIVMAQLVAQDPPAPAPAPTKDVARPVVAQSVGRTPVKSPMSEAGKAALAKARELAGRCKGLAGAERLQALAAAAGAYDQAVADFPEEPGIAGAAAFAAAELWRQHKSLALAEQDYLLAAETDPARFGPRGLFGAAEMQQRQKRNAEALVTYERAISSEPGSIHAQEARLCRSRLLMSMGRLDEAIVGFQGALEAARPGRDGIEAANALALACIQKGDLEAAERAIEHAEAEVTAVGEEDLVIQARLRKAVDAMTARKALQRARDKASRAVEDAAAIEAARQQRAG